MNKILVLSKGTGQAKAFERAAMAYTEKNNDPVEWIFATEATMGEAISKGDITVAIISPELMLVEKKLKAELETVEIPYITIKPVDFGLKNMEKIMPQLKPYIK
ncbi:hypothetical protein [Clostridium thermobutyricum]|uniref:hypothetical protein n=1 Tax=Clostridium thermobutyricum TaxID=29372 RepID=UPI0018A99FDA|nr:hypothetical protein [Clostridium thermobutyricum]